MDLFPDSLDPPVPGFDGFPCIGPCFFAIYPDEAALVRIVEQQHAFRRRLGMPAAALRPPELLHLSVADRGKPRNLVKPLDAAMRDAAGVFSFPPFDVSLADVARFGNGDTLVLAADEATATSFHSLRNALADAQARHGLVGSRGRIAPHVTLAYHPILPADSVSIPPIRFRATTVQLVVSEHGKGRHHRIDSWPLRD